MELEDDDVTKGRVLEIVIAIVLSVAAAIAATSVQLQDVDTRERLNATSAERAIERVSKDSDEKIDRVDANVQWLIKQQVETTAILRRLERNQ